MIDGLKLQACLELVAVIKHDDAAVRDVLARIARQLLQTVQAQGRQLTGWEKLNLDRALSALAAGETWLAWAGLDLALTSPGGIPAGSFMPAHAAAVAHLEIADFCRQLDEIDSTSGRHETDGRSAA